MANFTKQPTEQYPITVDFSNVLATGETISSKTVAAYLGSTSATSTVIDSSSISGDTVIVVVKAGTDGNTYKITVKITTSSSNVYEEDIIMTVKDY